MKCGSMKGQRQRKCIDGDTDRSRGTTHGNTYIYIIYTFACVGVCECLCVSVCVRVCGCMCMCARV